MRDARSILAIIMIAGVMVVELGIRAPEPAMQVATVATPRQAVGFVSRLRSAPIASHQPEHVQAVMAGIVFGRTENVSSADEDAFLNSGLWHLLAASGQNIALVIGMCIVLARALGGSKRSGTWLAVLAVPAYVMVVGGGASIMRAGIMGELALASWLTGRLRTAGHALLLAGCVTVWGWPGAHRTLGWQLSFACVAAMLVWTRPLSDHIQRTRMPESLAIGTAVTVLCSLATAPILILRTGSTPVLGGIANLVAVPMASLVLVVGLSGALVWMIAPVIAIPLLVGAGWCSRLLIAVAHLAAALPLAQTDSTVLGVGVPLICLLVAVSPPSIRARVVAATSLVGVAVLVGVWAVHAPAAARIPLVRDIPGGTRAGPVATGTVRIVALNIGQGDATLVAVPDHAILIDVGPPDGDVVDRVREMGVGRIDGVVLTHDSLDHRGGIEHVVAELHPRWLILPRDAPGHWGFLRGITLPQQRVCADDVLRLGAATITFENPPCGMPMPTLTGDAHNDNAIVSLVQFGSMRALISADAEGLVTSRLHLPAVDILRVGHHGSRDAGLAALLTQIQPRAAIISVGRGNTYGHPTAETLAALTAANVATYRTDLEGSIMVTSDGHAVGVEPTT